MPIPLYTYNNFDPNNDEALGTVIGKHAEAISLGRTAVAGLKGVFGGKASEIEKKLQDTINGAKEDFYKQLDKEYPNATAVIGVGTQVSEMWGFIIILMTGTAIRNTQSGGRKNKTLKRKQY